MGKRILVLGSSFGGFNVALNLRKLLGNDFGIKVVSSDPLFTFIPSLPWVLSGKREPSSLQYPVERRFRKHGIAYVTDTIVKLDPAKSEAYGTNGTYPYDYLVAATGSELDFDTISGLGPYKGHSHAIFTAEQALMARGALQKAISAGSGTLVFGNVQGASCLGPAYEIALIADAMLRAKKIRNRFRVVLFTSEPFLGHFGVGGFGALTRMLEDEFADRSIEYKLNCKLAGVTPDAVELEDGTKYKNDFSLITPAFYGSHAYMEANGLANPRGFILTDEFLANPAYPNIYAVGVSVAVAPPVATPVPVGVPKTGQMTHAMAKKASYNLFADIMNRRKVRAKDFNIACILDGGDTGFFLGAWPIVPPRNRLMHKEGFYFIWLKKLLEASYMAFVRHGIPFPAETVYNSPHA